MKNESIFDLLDPNNISNKLQRKAAFYAGVAAMAIAANKKLKEFGVNDSIITKLSKEVKNIHPKEDL